MSHDPAAPSDATTLRTLVAQGAQAHHDRPALTGPDGDAVTYGQLDELTEGFARWLAQHGIGGADVVALALPNGPAAAALTIASSCAASCAPLNPASAGPEVAYLLEDLGARAVVVRRGHRTRAAQVATARGIPVIELPEGPAAAAVGRPAWLGPTPTRRNPVAPAPVDVALRLYTSGTTGVPKQVPLSHANLCAAARQVVASLRLSPDDRCLNVMPLFHSHGLIGALLSTIAAGASIHCAPGLDPRRFLDWAAASGATWYTAAPTVHRAAIDAPGDHQGFRLIRSASASLPLSVLESLEARFDAPVIEVYGMTEAYQIAANPLPPGERRPGTVGRPTGTEVRLLADGRITAIGAGEIVLKGPNVFRGYASPPGADESAFVDGWFRTGDLGAIDDDGYLRITGRLKEQINRGGEKISPREVDDALMAHPGVRDALCFPVPDLALGEEVAAAVVRVDDELDTRALRRFLAERLAAFKVPKHVLYLDEIPRGQGGKPSRSALTERFADLAGPSSASDGPDPADTSALTTIDRLAGLWALVLETAEPPAATDHLFDLGGTSLDVMELVTQIEEVFEVDLPIDDVLELPTLQGMADEIDRQLSADTVRDRHHLLVMRDGDPEVAVVLVPGAHGMAIGLQAIAEHVRPGPMVVGFRYPGQLAREIPLRAIEDLASLLLEELVRRRIERVVLFGNSLGSWVVFEAARRLRAQGRPVLGLVLGDMYSPTLGRPRGLTGWLRSPLAATRGILHRRRKRREADRAIAGDRADAVFQASNQALSCYRGGPYGGDLDLLTTSRRADRLARPTYAWDDLVTGTVGVHPVPGEHEELHLLHAPVVAERINLHLP
jgi:acyl-CoA synthetase (AMP-forming)/AMP-acid ligase II/thioesterase domain-containing protein/acyl carrier protein